MQAGIALSGRRLLALFVAMSLTMSVVFLFAGPAMADGSGSPPECETAVNVDGGSGDQATYTAPDGKIVTGVCIKSGSQQFGGDKHSDLLGNGTWDNCYAVSGVGTATVTVLNVGDCQGISHIDVATSTRDTTTSSSQPTTTSTSQPTTTSTSQPTTTSTSQPTTTSTTEPSTTTTSGPQVQGAILVTVEGTCSVNDDDEGQGHINVVMSVPGGATVTIENSSGANVATVSDDADVLVPQGATYDWEAVPNDGFEFPAGFDASGQVVIALCEDEVEALEVLPFTGVDSGALAILAAALGMLGGLVLLATRKVEEQ